MAISRILLSQPCRVFGSKLAFASLKDSSCQYSESLFAPGKYKLNPINSNVCLSLK